MAGYQKSCRAHQAGHLLNMNAYCSANLSCTHPHKHNQKTAVYLRYRDTKKYRELHYTGTVKNRYRGVAIVLWYGPALVSILMYEQIRRFGECDLACVGNGVEPRKNVCLRVVLADNRLPVRCVWRTAWRSDLGALRPTGDRHVTWFDSRHRGDFA